MEITKKVVLCKEEFPPQYMYLDPSEREDAAPRFRAWWKSFASFIADRTKGNELNKQSYETLVAAFVGTKSEITVWSPMDKRLTSQTRVVRTQDDVIHETGERFRIYKLLPKQIEIYKSSEEQRVYMSGPPGCGKTLLLILQAAKWLKQRKFVVIVSSDVDNSVCQPVSMEMKRRITEQAKLLCPSFDESFLLLHTCYGTRSPDQIVADLREEIGNKNLPLGTGLVFLLDEVIDDKSRDVAACLAEMFPDSVIWSAGPWPKDRPDGFEHYEMEYSLRCPPVIQQLLKITEKACKEKHKYRYTTSSTSCETHVLPTDSHVKWICHHCVDSKGSIPLLLTDCLSCGHRLGDYLIQDLHIGSKEIESRLGFEDVLIVTHGCSLAKTPFLKGLRKAGVKVKAVESGTGKEETVAFPTGTAIATDISLVSGLERMVVVFVPESLEFEGSRAFNSVDWLDASSPEHRRLIELGKDNVKALWYILSRSLSHGVIFHFGESDLRRSAASSWNCFTTCVFIVVIVVVAIFLCLLHRY